MLLDISTVSIQRCSFNIPTDLRAGTNRWNTARLFIKMRYINITDYGQVISRYSCDTFCTVKFY